MARRLLASGRPVVVYDPDTSAAETQTRAGATVATDVVDLAQQCAVLVASLPSADISEAVATEIATGLNGTGQAQQSRYFIDTTTSHPTSSRRAAATLQSVGINFLDAPVSGGRRGATDGTLSIMIGGPATAVEACRPVLETLGTTITHFGEQVGAGGYAKLANQIMVSLHHTALAEAFAFAREAGIDLEQLVPALQAGWAASTVLDVKAPKILSTDYSAIGTVGIQDKDLTYILAAAEDLQLDLPGSQLAKSQFAELINQGDAGLDQIALMKLYEPSNKGE